MKRIILAIAIAATSFAYSQSVPEGINYQAVARDNAGSEIVSTSISVRFSIGTSSVTNSTYAYQETHSLNTNQFGLFNATIGQGNQSGGSGSFSNIPWDNPQYLLVEVDFGSGYEQMGIATPFVAVPYTLLAKDVLNKELPQTATTNDVLTWDGSQWVPLAPGSGSETTTTLADNTDGTFTYTNEIGTQVTFDANIDDADADATNEIQDLQLSGNTLTITNNGSATPIDLSIYNELPSSATTGQVLTWDGTSWIAQNSGTGADNWGSQTVVTDATLSGDGTSGSPLSGFDGDYANLTNTPTIPTATSELTNDSGFLTTEVDGDATNEIQDLSVAGNAINISGGTGTTISSSAPSAIGQVLTWDGTSWIAQNPGSGADNWGSQTVVTDATLSGDGTSGSPLSGFDGDYANLTNTPTIPTATSELTNDSGFLTTEVDGDATNEIQDLSVAGNAINISGGTGTTISSSAPSAIGQVLTWDGTSWIAQNPGSGADNWGSQTVVTDATLSGDGTSGSPLSGFDGDYTNLTNTPTIPTATSELTNDSGFLTSEVDGDATNEIQNLSIVGNTLGISGGGTSTPISSTTPTNGQVLTWNNSTNAWEATTPSTFTDTDDQTIDVLQLSGNNLEISLEDDGVATETLDLSAFMDNTDSQTLTANSSGGTATVQISGGNTVSFSVNDGDSDATNEHNTNFGVNGANLEITDGGGTLSVPLTSLSSPDNDWTKSGTTVYNTTDQIGIGTSTPGAQLEVISNSFSLLNLETTGANSNVNIDITTTGAGSAQFRVANGTGGYLFYTANGGSSPGLRIADNNNIGINLGSAPISALDVGGQITMRTGALPGYIPVADINGTMTWTDPTTITTGNDGDWTKSGTNIYNTSDNIGIGTATPSAKVAIASPSSTSSSYAMIVDNSASARLLSVRNDGWIGINTSTSVGSANLVINDNDNSSWAGMYINSDDLTNGRPFYGYSVNNSALAWSYLDVADGNKIKWNHGSQDRMTLTNTGNVGIGTTSPQFKLHAEDNTGMRTAYFINTTNAPFSATSEIMGVYGGAHGAGASDKIGGYFEAASGTGINYGVYGYASGGSQNWAGYFSAGDVYISNKIGVNTTSLGGYKVRIENTTETRGLHVQTASSNSTAYGTYFANNHGGTSFGYGSYSSSYGSGTGSKIGAYGRAYSTSTEIKYGVYGYAGGSGTLYAGYFSGDVYATGSYLPSDEKLKVNIEDYEGALEQIMNIDVKTYDYKQEGTYGEMNLPQGKQVGFIASNIASEYPGLIKKTLYETGINSEDPDNSSEESIEFNAVNYTGIVPVLTKATQEQQIIIEDLLNQIEQLKIEIEKLKTENQ